MTDRELLEMAAKAAGMVDYYPETGPAVALLAAAAMGDD